MRDSSLYITWYSSDGDDQLSCPCLPEEFGTKVDDLYIHTYQGRVQCWICDSLSPRVWSPLTQGSVRMTSVGQRVFVLTPGGQPSWVQADTIGRLYKHIILEGVNENR